MVTMIQVVHEYGFNIMYVDILIFLLLVLVGAKYSNTDLDHVRHS